MVERVGADGTLPRAVKREQVFYSWMDDGDAKLNRFFIEDCLKAAIRQLNRGTELSEYVVVRDTNGLPGMVDIGRVILERIREAAVFVGDVSIINPVRREDERPTPNPNVMFELGYAYAEKGEDAIIAVFNTARGEIQDLPFDVRPKRILTYHAANRADVEAAKPKLTAALLGALKLCLKDTEKTKVERNSVLADAITQARLLASEVEDWPNSELLLRAVEVVTEKLEAAMRLGALAGPQQNLLWSSLERFRAARNFAPHEENWPLIKQSVESAELYVRFLARNFRPDEETHRRYMEKLRSAPGELRKVVDAMEAEHLAEGSVSNALVAEMDNLSFAVREIALSGPDTRFPKFGEALLPLSRKLRKAALALSKGTLAAREIREMCAELEALAARYILPAQVSPQEVL